LITALKYPVPAAAACGLWSFSRIIYTLGYTTGEPKKRTRGNVGFISLIGEILDKPLYYAVLTSVWPGLLGGATYTVYGLLMAGI
jgi:glutathione S-transferase